MTVGIRREPETRVPYTGSIDLGSMSPRLSSELETAGISRAELSAMSHDGVIRSEDVPALLARVDGLARSGRSEDLSRANRLRSLIRQELACSPEALPAPAARPGVGCPRLTGHVDGPDGAHDRAPTDRAMVGRYRAAEMPELAPERPPPERPCLFIRILEFLFGWIPGVSTDTDRLRQYGRDLADRHGSELIAAETAWREQQARLPRNAAGLPEGQQSFRDAMVDQLARRMQAQGLDPGTARERAGVVVDAMLERREVLRQRDERRTSEVPMRDPGAPWAGSLSAMALPVRDRARALGPAWEARYRRALEPVPADHPLIRHTAPDRRARQSDEITANRLTTLATVMALQRSGQISNVPPEAVDQLLTLHHRGLIDQNALVDTLSELQRMPAAERTALLNSINQVPAERRHLAYAVLAREHFGLMSTNPAERAGSLRAVENATTRLRTLSTPDAEAEFRRGTLGLDGPENLRMTYQRNGRTETVDVPVYFHPGVPEAQRQQHRELLREAYQHVPPALMRRMLEGEGGDRFAVQVLPQSAIESDEPIQARPDSASPEGGHYRPEHNHLRLNATEVSRQLSEGPAGRARALNMVLHESAHDFDDLANPDQEEGLFATRSGDVGAARAHIEGDGELAPAWAHFRAMEQRYRHISSDPRDPDMIGSRLYRNTGRPGDQQRWDRAMDRMAGRSGAVTEYGALGGDDRPGRNPRLRMGEWWAETYAHYLNPATRDRLRASDPVAHAACARYTELIEQGATPQDAMRQALRYSLSTEVAAQQGRSMLGSAGAGPLNAQQLGQLEGITDAFERHGRALDGWAPFANDPGLRAMRVGEADRGVTEGRALLAQISERRAHAAPGSEEHRRLGQLESRLRTAITNLEQQANRLRTP